jgi:hypothetical protein
VATLRRLVKLKKKTRAKLGERPKRQLREVLAEVARQQESLGHVSGAAAARAQRPAAFTC